MRPHEWAHPNVLTVRDSAFEAGEEAEEEPREEDGHVSSEHGHGHELGQAHGNDHHVHCEETEDRDDDLGHGAHTGGRPTKRERMLARLRAGGHLLPTPAGDATTSPRPSGPTSGPPLGEEARDRRLTAIIQAMEAEGRAVLTAEEIRTIEVDFPDHDPVNPEPTGPLPGTDYGSTVPDTDHTLEGPRPPPGPPPGWYEHEEEDDTGPGSSTGTGTEPQAKPRATNPRKWPPHLPLLLFAVLCKVLGYLSPCTPNWTHPGEGEVAEPHRVSPKQEMLSPAQGGSRWTKGAADYPGPLFELLLQPAYIEPFSMSISGHYGKRMTSNILASEWLCRHSQDLLLPWTHRYNIHQFNVAWVGHLFLYGALLTGCYCIVWTKQYILSRLRMTSPLNLETSPSKAGQNTAIQQLQFCHGKTATAGRLNTTSRTGPKSGHIHTCNRPTHLFQLIWLAVCIYPVQTVNVDVRVGGLSAMPPEVPVGTKLCGAREASAPKPEHSDNHRIIKRTYSRAFARAARQGGSYYKGRWRSFQWFQKVPIQPVYLPRPRPAVGAQHRLRVLTWNAGGLTKPTFQELETFIRDERLDVIFIQETKWTEEYCWGNKDYSYIHSAGTNKFDKVGGLLTMVSTRLAKNSDIQFNHVWAGRLLHVRIPAGNTSIDLINAYQFSANDKSETLTRRQHYLQRLQRCLAGLPRRHSLIMSGDLNTTCESTPNVCGKHVLPIGEYHKQDFRDFMHICEALSLTVLNTWTRPTHKQLATFRFGSLSSQIDFVIVRRAQADNEARRAQVMVDYPVAGWREGAKHFPAIASVPVPKQHWQADAKTPMQQVDLPSVLHDLHHDPQAPRLQAFQEAVAETLHPSSDFDSVVLQAALQHYPRPPRPQVAPTQPAKLANSARHMWQLFRQMRTQRFSMQGIMEAWKLWTRFAEAHRLHKQRANRRAKARRDELLAQAQDAATKGDLHQMWSVVKRLAPKTQFRRVQLHKHGLIMAPEAELDWIATAFGERYGAEHSALPGPLRRQHPPVQVLMTDVKAALQQLPARKAVPPGVVPSALWKACANQLAGPLTAAVNEAWRQPLVEIQQPWADADVALLPKGSKKAKTPLDLRPIGLQHPLGKTMMKVLTLQAKECIATMVKRWPQTAYIPGRSTTTALKVVMSHCAGVRTACAGTRLNIHQ